MIKGYIVVDKQDKPLSVGFGYGFEGERLPKSGQILWLGDFATIFLSRRVANKALQDTRWYDNQNNSNWQTAFWRVIPLKAQP